MDNDLIWYYLSTTVLVVTVLYIGISSVKNKLLMYFIISLTIMASVVSIQTVKSLLGYPIEKSYQDDSIYLYHVTNNDNSITVWLIEPNDLRPRAIILRVTDEQKKAAADAKKKSKDGVPQKLKNPKNNGDPIFYDFVVQDPAHLKE